MNYLNYEMKLPKCYSAVLMDVMDTMGFRDQCMDPTIRPLRPSMKAWGEAVTIYLEAVEEIAKRPYQLEMEVIDDLKEGQEAVGTIMRLSHWISQCFVEASPRMTLWDD